jgi:hypothetical protein
MVGAAAKPPATPQPPPSNKPRPSAPPREEGAKSRRSGRISPWLRVFLSLFVVWHFTAVFLAALSMPVTSPLVYKISQDGLMQWYLDALYMNQQHSFFAPDVGPGNIIRYELFDQAGQVVEHGELPNRKEHWPRLRYHRHFMLADQADFSSNNEQYRKQWQRAFLEGFARQLLRVNEDAASVRVRRVAHWPIPRTLAIEGRKITDPQGYETQLEVTQRRSDLGPPESGQTNTGHERPMNTAQRWIGVMR